MASYTASPPWAHRKLHGVAARTALLSSASPRMPAAGIGHLPVPELPLSLSSELHCSPLADGVGRRPAHQRAPHQPPVAATPATTQVGCSTGSGGVGPWQPAGAGFGGRWIRGGGLLAREEKGKWAPGQPAGSGWGGAGEAAHPLAGAGFSS